MVWPATETFKRREQFAYLVLCLATLLSLGAGLFALVHGEGNAGKWIACAGLLATAAGVVQLDVSGVFQWVMEKYGDEEKYPYGPPSHITRQIVDEPDSPTLSTIRHFMYRNPRTGFHLILVGTLVQVVAAWL